MADIMQPGSFVVKSTFIPDIYLDAFHEFGTSLDKATVFPSVHLAQAAIDQQDTPSRWTVVSKVLEIQKKQRPIEPKQTLF